MLADISRAVHGACGLAAVLGAAKHAVAPTAVILAGMPATLLLMIVPAAVVICCMPIAMPADDVLAAVHAAVWLALCMF